jgi:hypothetical protein
LVNAVNREAIIMGVAAPKAEQVISLKVTLRGIRPPIWRRLEVPSRLSLGGLHDAIQAAMGWGGHHLYMFDVAGRSYGDPAAVDDVADDSRLTVGGVMEAGVRRFTYTYDFGDDWEHDIVIEAKKAAVDGRRYPACTAGKRNCPPDDCGGVWGYRDLLAALANPSRSEAREWSEWMELGFDPEQFSIETVDARIGARLKSQPA